MIIFTYLIKTIKIMEENYTLLELYEMYAAGVLTSEMMEKCLN